MDLLLPAEPVRRELAVSNSRFIATLAPVRVVEEARAFFARVRAEYPDATHNVPAYLLGGGNSVREYCSDDGEPSGTAGRPVLAVLRGSGMGDVGLVVTRYFGGKLLGKGGLVKAYTGAARLAVEAAPRARVVPVQAALLACPYALLERVRLLVSRFGGAILEESFAEGVTLSLHVPVRGYPAFQASLRELSAGKLQAERIETLETLVRV